MIGLYGQVVPKTVGTYKIVFNLKVSLYGKMNGLISCLQIVESDALGCGVYYALLVVSAQIKLNHSLRAVASLNLYAGLQVCMELVGWLACS